MTPTDGKILTHVLERAGAGDEQMTSILVEACKKFMQDYIPQEEREEGGD